MALLKLRAWFLTVWQNNSVCDSTYMRIGQPHFQLPHSSKQSKQLLIRFHSINAICACRQVSMDWRAYNQSHYPQALRIAGIAAPSLCQELRSRSNTMKIFPFLVVLALLTMGTAAVPQTSSKDLNLREVSRRKPSDEERCLFKFPQEGKTKPCSRCDRLEECIHFRSNRKSSKALLRCECDLGSKFYEINFSLCPRAGIIEKVIRWSDHRYHCNSWDLSCVGHPQCRKRGFSAGRYSLLPSSANVNFV